MTMRKPSSPARSALIGVVSTDSQNEILEFIEKFGSHQQQYATLVATLVGFSKAMGDDLEQLQADIDVNWRRVGAPSVLGNN